MDLKLHEIEVDMATQIAKGDSEFLAAGGADDADNSLYLIEAENKKMRMIQKHE